MSLFRCAPTDRKRPIFNWIHRIIGLGGLFCSCKFYLSSPPLFDPILLSIGIGPTVVNYFPGAAIWWGKKFSMGLNQKYWNGDPAMGIMIFYFVVLGVTAIALEIHMFVTEVVKNPSEIVSSHLLATFFVLQSSSSRLKTARNSNERIR